MDGYIALSYWDLAAASALVFINAGLSVIFRLRLHRSLLIAAIRMVVQLALVGVVLTTLFSVVSPLWTGLTALGMVLFAGHEAAQRQERRLSGWWSYGLGTGSMMVSSVVVTVFALLTALRPNPWYDPRYAIPLLGMILGNCMTGIALGLDTLTTSLVSRRAGVEAQLMLGATRQEAVAPVTRQALRSALMPTINSMSATGVVSLPGMMTGQILGGVPPAEAVKYQILVMFLIAGGTGLGAVTAVLGGVYRLTDGRHRLRLDRLGRPKRGIADRRSTRSDLLISWQGTAARCSAPPDRSRRTQYLEIWRGCRRPDVNRPAVASLKAEFSCVRQVQQIGHGEGCGGSFRSIEQHPLVRSERPSLRPDLAFGRAPRAAAVKDAAANAVCTGGAGAKRPWPSEHGARLNRSAVRLRVAMPPSCAHVNRPC